MVGHISKNGYKRVCLILNHAQKNFSVHRLVGIHFIPNPNNKPQINHKDGVKINNFENNLEWLSSKENVLYSFEKLGRKGHPFKNKKYGKANPLSKQISQLTLSGQFIRRWDCMADIYRDTGINFRGVSLCCLGKKKTTGGFKWEFYKEN